MDPHPQQTPVVVYVLTEDRDSADAQKVRNYFNTPYFLPLKIKVEDPEGAEITEPLHELASLRSCLEHAQANYPSNYLIVIKDSSVSRCDGDQIETRIRRAINAGGWDIFYLCNWLDRCDLYSSVSDEQPIKTQYPRGLQAILLTPEAREMLLGTENLRNGKKISYVENVHITLQQAIKSGALEAACLKENLFDFDYQKAKNPADYLKTQRCAIPPGGNNFDPITSYASTPNTTSGFNNNWIWGLLIFLAVVIIIILALRR